MTSSAVRRAGIGAWKDVKEEAKSETNKKDLCREKKVWQEYYADPLKNGAEAYEIKKPDIAFQLPCIGTLIPRTTDEIAGSNWLLGCETLDRDYADYDQYKEYLRPLGIKYLRFQGGWVKTEKARGSL